MCCYNVRAPAARPTLSISYPPRLACKPAIASPIVRTGFRKCNPLHLPCTSGMYTQLILDDSKTSASLLSGIWSLPGLFLSMDWLIRHLASYSEMTAASGRAMVRPLPSFRIQGRPLILAHSE